MALTPTLVNILTRFVLIKQTRGRWIKAELTDKGLGQPAPTASITFTEYDQVKAPKAQVIDGKTLGL